MQNTSGEETVKDRRPDFIEERSACTPFFSICIPQYSRYPFLLEQLEILARQTFRNFEVCISDDYSPEQEQADSVIDFLRRRKLAFAYRFQSKSLRYDANLRAAIDLSLGEYVVLMGNDDKLANEKVLELLHRRIAEALPVAVVITNYQEISTGRVFRRVSRDGIVGSGVDIAVRTYRDYSFFSGLVFRREDALRSRTDAWDGSEMYQMFLGSRIIASGGRLLGVSNVAILKDIQIPGLEVDSYRNRKIEYSERVAERVMPLCQIPSLVWNAVAPLAPENLRARIAWDVLRQMLVFTYPYWIVELRRVHGFRYGYEVCLGMRPRHLIRRMHVPNRIRWATQWLFIVTSAVSLLFPVFMFEMLNPVFHAIAKRRGSRRKRC